MVEFDGISERLYRLVRQASKESGKQVRLDIVGGNIEVDRGILERMTPAFEHLLRNCVVHGIEGPDTRRACGKDATGTITIEVQQSGNDVAVQFRDDGAGLDLARIRARAIERGLIAPEQSLSDAETRQLVFQPGFTTATEVTDLAGRGVGLDVVRDSVRALRGSVSVESSPGKGTSFTFRLPLTLALIDGLLIETGGGRYVVPLAQVEECVALGGVQQALSSDRPCVAVRGELVPTVSLRSLFGIDGPPPPRQELLLTRHSGRRVGVAVDRLNGRVQAVIQSLGEGLHGVGRFSGATILGDGRVALILDIASMVRRSRH